jgi:hypothetical protein
MDAERRHLLYARLALRLPVVGIGEVPESGLAFYFLADADTSIEFIDGKAYQRRILTGRSGGPITISLAKADTGKRETIYETMNELYRTLLGHFRHESGHYYWGWLIRSGQRIEKFRALFGDERQDYKEELDCYHQSGAEQHWHQYYVSAYATVHPWEDWAETWALNLRMVDSLETAADEGVAVRGNAVPSILFGATATLQRYAGNGLS